jgi:hypothetical protein
MLRQLGDLSIRSTTDAGHGPHVVHLDHDRPPAVDHDVLTDLNAGLVGGDPPTFPGGEVLDERRERFIASRLETPEDRHKSGA